LRKCISFTTVTLILMLLIGCLEKDELVKQDIILSGLNSYWFEQEKTLFVFYSIQNKHGFSPDARIELNYDGENWNDVETIKNVHVHRDAICAPSYRCKALSIKLDRKPDVFNIRYLYHKDGELSEEYTDILLDMEVSYPESIDSFQVFGVFAEGNRYFEWRGYHNFPGLSQGQVEAYGLERSFETNSSYTGNQTLDVKLTHPTLFGDVSDCDSSDSFSSEILNGKSTANAWATVPIPEGQEDVPWVCTIATVATGAGTTMKAAIARKNPEFTALFDNLGITFEKSQVIQVLYSTCDANKNEDYLDFQVTRMKFASSTTDICIDAADFNRTNLINTLSDKIRDERASNDGEISLSIILHYSTENAGTAAQAELESALTTLVADTSLAVNAIFVYDSFEKLTLNSRLKKRSAWCPTIIDAQETFTSCYLAPSNITFGPLEIKSSPLLPTFTQFEEMEEADIADITVEAINFYVPTTEGDNLLVDYLEDSGEYYFFDSRDVISAAAEHSFSSCSTKDPSQTLAFADTIELDTETKESYGGLGSLPPYHFEKEEDKSYIIGAKLYFPFLMEINFQRRVRIGPKSLVSYVSLKRSSATSENFGDARLLLGNIKLGDALKQCVSYCTHPSFNDRSEYSLGEAWKTKYMAGCYNPTYPVKGGA